MQKVSQLSDFQNKWEFEYGTMNYRRTLALKGGLSAQICFAKYAAFKKGAFFLGYSCQVPSLSYDDDFVQKTLSFVYNEIKSHNNLGNTALYSPGVCSVPYILQTTNFIYFPSHFLIGVTSMSKLQTILYKARQKGYKCYAVVGYDGCLKNTLCAWIKFVQMPKQYIKLIQELNIKNIVTMAVFDPNDGGSHGSQRIARLYNFKFNQPQRRMPRNGDIYMLFVNQSYGKSPQVDVDLFAKYVSDVPKQVWQTLITFPHVPYIHDWQSGIDCLQNIQSSTTYLLDYEPVNFSYILSDSSWQLYKIAYFLGKRFIVKNYDEKINPHKQKGIVFNQYFMSSPTYEMGYGYVPVPYWQFYPQNEKRLLKMLTDQDKKLELWFNMHAVNSLPFSDATLQKLRQGSYSKKPAFIIKSNNKCIQIGQWITKYAKTSYDYVKYLTLEQVQDSMKEMGLHYQRAVKFMQ